MSINHAILGILSCRSLSGYDIKKVVQESPFMPWSGNNNQIYKALVELLEKGFVTHEVQHQESSPSKKIYTITQEGVTELKAWVTSKSEAPEIKSTFLIQLAWADLLDKDHLRTMLAEYEEEIRAQCLMQQEKVDRGIFSPGRTPREKFLWDQIYNHIIDTYQKELEWVIALRQSLEKEKS